MCRQSLPPKKAAAAAASAAAEAQAAADAAAAEAVGVAFGVEDMGANLGVSELDSRTESPSPKDEVHCGTTNVDFGADFAARLLVSPQQRAVGGETVLAELP